MASLIITESIAEARSKKQELYVASLDARKAFDVVSHPIVMKKLYDMGISSPIWGTINSIYNESVEVIRWAGRDSRQYGTYQGVKQGSILSPTLYKIYINDLLQQLENNQLGNHIGSTFVGSPTCADDVLLISPCKFQH